MQLGELCSAAQTRSVQPQCKFTPGADHRPRASRTFSHLLLCSILYKLFRLTDAFSPPILNQVSSLFLLFFLSVSSSLTRFSFLSRSLTHVLDGCSTVHASRGSLDSRGFHARSGYIEVITKIEPRDSRYQIAPKGFVPFIHSTTRIWVSRLFSFPLVLLQFSHLSSDPVVARREEQKFLCFLFFFFCYPIVISRRVNRRGNRSWRSMFVRGVRAWNDAGTISQ